LLFLFIYCDIVIPNSLYYIIITIDYSKILTAYKIVIQLTSANPDE